MIGAYALHLFNYFLQSQEIVLSQKWGQFEIQCKGLDLIIISRNTYSEKRITQGNIAFIIRLQAAFRVDFEYLFIDVQPVLYLCRSRK